MQVYKVNSKAMSPLMVENFLFLAKNLIKCRLRHLLNAASYKGSTFNDDIANSKALGLVVYIKLLKTTGHFFGSSASINAPQET